MQSSDEPVYEAVVSSRFSANLRVLMVRSGLTQTRFSAMIDVSQAAISNYVNGRLPEVVVMLRIARAFDVTVEELCLCNL